MESKAKVLGHPVHPMLVAIPLGLFATSLVFDLIRLGGGSEGFGVAAFYMIGAGIIGGLCAGIFGFVDFLAIPSGTRAKSVGAFHGLTNVVVLGLFVVSWELRFAGDPSRPSGAAISFSVIGILLALLSSWLGGELVHRLGVGVDDGANLDASSSLSGRPASERWTSRPLEQKRA